MSLILGSQESIKLEEALMKKQLGGNHDQVRSQSYKTNYLII